MFDLHFWLPRLSLADVPGYVPTRNDSIEAFPYRNAVLYSFRPGAYMAPLLTYLEEPGVDELGGGGDEPDAQMGHESLEYSEPDYYYDEHGRLILDAATL